jgi:hypothetical protein
MNNELSGQSSAALVTGTDEMAVIKIRLKGSIEAVKRARLAFLASTVASLAVFITEWNAYLSWYRRFPLREKFPDNEITREAFKYVLQEFVQSRVITVSLLGIRVGVSDMAVLGSLSLLVFSIWLFFSIRRHNHTTGSLLRDTQSLEPVVRRLVYYGVSSFLVFTTITSFDGAISTLEEEAPSKEARLSRGVVTFLFYLPAIVIGLTILGDILSVYKFHAVFSFPHDALGKGELSPELRNRFLIMELLAVSIGVPTFYLCRKIIHFEKSTAMVLRQYLKLLSEPIK